MRTRAGINDRVVLVTGAARGIGADTAKRLVEGGARVALVDRDEHGVRQTADDLGENAEAFVADITDPAAITATVDAAAACFGRLDVVVANAGVMSEPDLVANTDLDEFRRVLEVNVLGTFNTVRAALPHVVKRGGYVLCVSSIAGLIPVPLLAPYVASKHAVDGFARSLRLELASTGTKVGIAYFGVIDTDMARETIASSAAHGVWGSVPQPLGRSVSVACAGKAVVQGIEKRSRWVYAPSWMSGVLGATRAISDPLERLSGRYPALTRAINAQAGQGDSK